jgi:L-threonylcarbamoyladenylate synthase
MPILAATDETVKRAAEALQRGKLVAFPTETVYGLGANALDPVAVTKVFAAKDRPRFNPLIVHVLDLPAAERLAEFNDAARKLAAAFWPGALTLVLPRRGDCDIAELASAGLGTIALRAPSHKVARALLKAAKVPIAAPSANRSGRVSPTTAAHVETELGELPAMILDGGSCQLGLESTVVGVHDDIVTLLRPGAVARAEIETILGQTLSAPDMGNAPSSPGQLASHYAPDTPLRLNVVHPLPGEALLAFGPDAPAFKGPTLNLSQSGDLAEAAANFFAALRSLDALEATAIAVMPVPQHGLGEAINDRLKRASAARTELAAASSSP